MRVLSVDKLKSGMIVGRSIYGSGGEILLAAGMEINQRYIQRLEQLGIMLIYIKDEVFDDVEIDDVVSDKTRKEAVKATKEFINGLKLNKKLDTKRVSQIVNNIIDDLMSNKDIIVNLVDLRAMNDYTFSHSVNVAILATIIGIENGYDQIKLRNLAAGALFHDIGKTLIPENILNKTTPFTAEEENEVKQHPTLGFEILRKIEGFNLLSAHVAFQHHEKFDGTGYPRGLMGKEIDEFARIVTIAEFYDTLTSKGQNQKSHLPRHALEYIVLNSGKFFDPKFVEIFIYVIALFPVGSIVILNTGEQGAVIKVNKKFPSRPVLRILYDATGNKVDPSYDIDLVINQNYYIEKVLAD